jgi:hypothetical protein
MATVTCHAAGCGNADVPIDLPLVSEREGETVEASSVVCGVCGQEITDIADDERTGS